MIDIARVVEDWDLVALVLDDARGHVHRTLLRCRTKPKVGLNYSIFLRLRAVGQLRLRDAQLQFVTINFHKVLSGDTFTYNKRGLKSNLETYPQRFFEILVKI